RRSLAAFYDKEVSASNRCNGSSLYDNAYPHLDDILYVIATYCPSLQCVGGNSLLVPEFLEGRVKSDKIWQLCRKIRSSDNSSLNGVQVTQENDSGDDRQIVWPSLTTLDIGIFYQSWYYDILNFQTLIPR